MISFIRSIYLTTRFFWLALGVVLSLVLSYIIPVLFPAVKGILAVLLGILFIELLLLYRHRKGIVAERETMDKLSNGDENDIYIHVRSQYPFKTYLQIIDDIPPQFQARNTQWNMLLLNKESKTLKYTLRPTKRGEYTFGAVNVFASMIFGLVQRRYRFSDDVTLPVYPAFLQLKKYEFAAFTNKLQEIGIKKIRRLGQSMEFEQIMEYVRGDDPRRINWKASARSNGLKVNHYQEEKSQPVYCIIDKGRLMRFPFEQLSLLDYAINASLIMSNIAIKKQDKAGIITFGNKLSSVVSASNRSGQMQKIMEALYRQKTKYLESNFELLSLFVNTRISQRSLLLCFTNFESMSSFKRQLPYFVSLSKKHLVVIVFFKNTEIQTFNKKESPDSSVEIYQQVIAQGMEADKVLMVRRLRKYGIHAVLTEPQNLTVDTINKYLELKASGRF